MRQRIYNTLAGSQTLSDKVGSEIYFHFLPDNWTGNAAILYILSRPEKIKALGGKLIAESYNVTFTILADKIEDCYDISVILDSLFEDQGETELTEPSYDEQYQKFVLELNYKIIK